MAFVQADVCKQEEMEQLFKQYSFDGVIHLASLKSVSESIQQPLVYYRNNVNATLTLLACMQKRGIKRFVYSSSATVYGAANAPVPESARTGSCINPYGWTKYMCEQIIRDYAVTDPHFSAVVLRYFNPVGAHDSGLLGEDPKDTPNNLMPLIVRAAQGKSVLEVFGDDYDTSDGTGVRDYIHVMDLAEGHLAALAYTEGHSGIESFNLGSGRGYSVLELIQTYEQTNQLRVPYKITRRRPGDIPVSFADIKKAKRILGWQPERSLEHMCRSAYQWGEASSILKQ